MYSRARNGYACQYQHPDIAGREIWGKLDLIYDDWRGATRDPELDMSRTWEWKLMEKTRVSFFLVQDSCGGAVLRIGVLSSRSRTCHVSGETDGFPLLWTRAASSFCGFKQLHPSVDSSSFLLLWTLAASSFCGLEQLPPSMDSSNFLLLWIQAASSFCGLEQLPSENLNIVI